MKLILSDDFPASPPKGLFLTKIFHPNVSKSGEICVNTLKKDWKTEYGIAHVLTVIKCLLIHPNAESALNEDAGKLLLERLVLFACDLLPCNATSFDLTLLHSALLFQMSREREC